MGLETYRAKRDFGAHPSRAAGRSRAARASGSFVVQKHLARQLHYDFRLELGGVLVSWAVPKGPSLDPADKRLAMHVEDHPLEYAGFEGVIPDGEYGGGTVMVWDTGRWVPRGDPVAGYRAGHLKFTLQGRKLKGNWSLVRTRDSRYAGKAGREAWLLIKETDEHARPGSGSIVDTAAESVVSGRTLDEIAVAAAHAAPKENGMTAASAPVAAKRPSPRAQRCHQPSGGHTRGDCRRCAQ